MIAATRKNGSFRYIVVERGGEPQGVGKTLLKHYRDKTKVRRLLDGGDLLFVGEKIGKKHDFDSAHDEHPTWCCAYRRDKGDEEHGVRTASGDDELLKLRFQYKYVYINEENTWLFATNDFHGELKENLA